jgi:hypothetical protein
MGEVAKRRTRPRSTILRNKSKVTKDICKMFVSGTVGTANLRPTINSCKLFLTCTSHFAYILTFVPVLSFYADSHCCLFSSAR